MAAGILGLEAYTGFLFYLLGTCLVSALIWGLLAQGRPGRYFGTGPSSSPSSSLSSSNKMGSDGGAQGSNEGEVGEGATWRLWTEEVIGGLSSFVLTWTLFYGLVRA